MPNLRIWRLMKNTKEIQYLNQSDKYEGSTLYDGI